MKANDGSLIPLTRNQKESGCSQQPPLEVTHPELMIKSRSYEDYDRIIASNLFKIRLSKGYWIQEILGYLGEIHGFNIFELLNVQEKKKRGDIIGFIDKTRRSPSGNPDKHEDIYNSHHSSSNESEKETKTEARLRSVIERENKAMKEATCDKVPSMSFVIDCPPSNDENLSLSSYSQGIISQVNPETIDLDGMADTELVRKNSFNTVEVIDLVNDNEENNAESQSQDHILLEFPSYEEK